MTNRLLQIDDPYTLTGAKVKAHVELSDDMTECEKENILGNRQADQGAKEQV